jgi:hypothetical protein
MIDQSFESILSRFKINIFIETGTDMGETVAEVAGWFAKRSPDFGVIESHFETGAKGYNAWNVPIKYPKFSSAKASNLKVYSVDLDRNAYEKAAENFKSNPNIILVHESSEKFLREAIKKYQGDSVNRLFFFLDAHWGNYWPVRDELKAIAAMDRFAIAIDDFYVPEKSNRASARGDFGFDFYHGRILCWGYIRDCFAPGSVRIFYPNRPNRDKRGWCLITRGYDGDDIAYLNSIGLTEWRFDDPKHVGLETPVLATYMDLRIFLRMLLPLNWLRRGFQVMRGIRP